MPQLGPSAAKRNICIKSHFSRVRIEASSPLNMSSSNTLLFCFSPGAIRKAAEEDWSDQPILGNWQVYSSHSAADLPKLVREPPLLLCFPTHLQKFRFVGWVLLSIPHPYPHCSSLERLNWYVWAYQRTGCDLGDP